MSCGCNGCKSWWLRATRHRCLNTRRQKYAAAQPWGQGPWCCHLPLWAQEPKWGAGCIINAGAIVDHNAVLEDGVHAAPRATIKAGATVERCMKVDSGEIIRSPWEK